jgi:hypothetical protein
LGFVYRVDLIKMVRIWLVVGGLVVDVDVFGSRN